MTTRPTSEWTKIGLVIALLGIPVIVTAQHLLFPDPTPVIKAARELLILTLSAFLLWIIVKGERLPLSSVGFRGGVVAHSLGCGVGLAVVSFAAVLGCLAAFSTLGIPYGESGSISRSLPVTFLTITRAGFSEELFYRGYAIERIEALTGNRWAAAIVSLLAFGLFHFWLGAAGVIVALVIGAVITAFYMWKRDLIAAMFAHFLVDFVPNILLPLFGASG